MHRPCFRGVMYDGEMRAAFVAVLACLASSGVGCSAQACVKSSDCNSGCCAPAADEAGNLVGPYECQGGDKCCDPLFNPCPGATCCVSDPHENKFCSTMCTSTASCAGGTICEAYSFADSACPGPMACGPDL
jgi:hypothetical protein